MGVDSPIPDRQAFLIRKKNTVPIEMRRPDEDSRDDTGSLSSDAGRKDVIGIFFDVIPRGCQRGIHNAVDIADRSRLTTCRDDGGRRLPPHHRHFFEGRAGFHFGARAVRNTMGQIGHNLGAVERAFDREAGAARHFGAFQAILADLRRYVYVPFFRQKPLAPQDTLFFLP